MKNFDIVKIAYVTLSMNVGGMERLVLHLSNKIDREKYAITVICLDFGGELLDLIHEIGCASIILQRSPGFDWHLIIELAKIFRNHHFKIIHTHNQAAHFYGTLAAKLARVPVLLTTEHSRHNSEMYFRRQLEKRTLCMMTDKWITVSDELAEFAIHKDKLPASKVAVIKNGIDVNLFVKPDGIEKSLLKIRFGLPPDCQVVSIVARLHPIKNHTLLIEALSELRVTLPLLHVVLIGDGECRDSIFRQVTTLGITDRVHFLGTRHEIPELLWMSDVFVLCSLSEGLPFSLIEAAAASIPIVITKSANRANFIHDGVNGFISDDNSKSLAKLILEVFQDDKIRIEALTRTARMIVEKDFSIKAMVDKYTRLYQELLLCNS